MVLTGDSGVGKSGVLNYICMYALKNDWIVVGVPKSFNWTQKSTEQQIMRHSVSGLYIQNEFAKEWLEYFLHMNKNQLKSFVINKDLYGKYNFSGLHDNDPEAVPDTYYKKRKAYFSEHK